jgi:hypothetical protein
MSTPRAVLPREYGAYAELAFPLVTAFLVGGVTIAGVCFTIAVVAGFLVREPMAVLNGVRGARLEASLRTPAKRAAWILVLLGLLGGGLGMVFAPAGVRPWAVIPAACAAVLAPALLRGRPKTLAAEIVVALALATMILPVGLSGRLGVETALVASAVWAVSFILATLAVHAIKARAKPDLGATWAIRVTPVLAGAAAVAGLGGAVMGLWPWTAGAAVVPAAVLVMAALGLRTHPRRLKRVGWSLVGANVVTLVLLTVGR